MPDGADTEELANVLHFERYMAKNIASWYKYVLVERGRQVENGEVRLVIGRDNSRTWGMAVFENASTHGDALQLKFKPTDEDILGNRRYTWEASSAVALARTGPNKKYNEELTTADYLDIKNQTLFIRTLNARLSNNLWQKLTAAIATELMRLYEDHEGHDLFPESFTTSTSSARDSSRADGPPVHNVDAYRSSSRGSMFQYKGLVFDYSPPVGRVCKIH